MLPAKLVKFINEEADTAVLGTRNANNEPMAHRCFGWRAHEDGRRVTVLVPHFSLAGIVEAIADNGRAALSLGNHVNHETYQIKGAVTGPDELTEEDIGDYEAFVARAVVMGAAHGIPEAVIRAVAVAPELSVTMTAEDLFLQTPGPEAGKRLADAGGE